MVGLTLRGIWARKLRAFLTGLAVMLGVMMVCGTFVFTDTISRAFDDIFQQANKNIATVVQSRQAFSVNGSQPPPFSQSVLPKVKKVPGVKLAAGTVSDFASIILSNGKQVKTSGAPPLMFSAVPQEFDPLTYVEGRAPTTASEIAIDKGTADKENVKIGDAVKLAGNAPAQPFTVVGVAKYGSISSIGGATIAVVTLPQAQKISGRVGQLDQIEVGAEPGISDDEMTKRVGAILPPSLEAETGSKSAQDQSNSIKGFVGFLQYLLLAFGIIALFVGAFIIFNTFSITVAQRTKEFALLRMLGASGSQVRRSVLLDALIIGVTASVIGVVAGVLVAKGIDALFKAFGADLPQQGTVVETRTIVVGLLVGIGVTLVSGLVPAIRATRVLPLAAIREDAARGTRRASAGRIVATVILLVLGAALVVGGLFAGGDVGQALIMLGLGAALLFIAVALLASNLVKPLAAIVGAPLQALRGVEGQLARENSMRNPSRTATTAAALMIGLAIVTFVTVLASGFKASITDALDNDFKATLVLESSSGNGATIPATVAPAVARVPGVTTVSPLKSTEGEVSTKSAGRTQISGIDPRTIGQVWKFNFKDGSPASLTRMTNDEAYLDADYAKDKKFEPGTRMLIEGSSGAKHYFTVTGTADLKNSPFGKILVTNEAASRFFEQKHPIYTMLLTAPGADVGTVKTRVDALLDKQFPTVDSKTQSEFKDELVGQITGLVNLLYALLSLSVIVSLFGIVNTLVLSITERTREIGMLRAIGTSRRQVRRVVRYESVITALIGGVLGLVLGLFLGVLTTVALSSEGLIVSIPFGSLFAFLILAAIAGILAAIPPARRASRIDVLEALAYE